MNMNMNMNMNKDNKRYMLYYIRNKFKYKNIY